MANKKFGRLVVGRPSVGLALSSGGARGWAHVGVLEAFRDLEVPIDIIAGTSAGAVIGSYYASGAFQHIREFAENMKSFRTTLTYLDIKPGGGGIIDGKRFVQVLESHLPVRNFNDLAIPFGVVATDLNNMQEVHITEGALLPAIRASMAIPGLFNSYDHGGVKLVDGGLLNPLPTNLARKLGADIVIAVDLYAYPDDKEADPGDLESFTGVFNRTIETMQQRILKMNKHTDPADFYIQPDVHDFTVMDFHRAEEAIQIGYKAAVSQMNQIRKIISGGIKTTSGKVIFSTPDFVSRIFSE